MRLTSIQKREPPEPDVLCQYTDGQWVAFELVEICNRRNARFMGSSHLAYAHTTFAYQALPPEHRQRFDERFIDVPLSFHVRPEASMNALRKALPSLLVELISATRDEISYEYGPLSAAVQGAIGKVREGGKHVSPGEVNFNIGGSFDPVIPLDAIAAKLSKRYAARGPVELLAHFGALAWGQDKAYQQRIHDLFANRGLGQFRRVWVMDWNGISLTFPSR